MCAVWTLMAYVWVDGWVKQDEHNLVASELCQVLFRNGFEIQLCKYNDNHKKILIFTNQTYGNNLNVEAYINSNYIRHTRENDIIQTGVFLLKNSMNCCISDRESVCNKKNVCKKDNAFQLNLMRSNVSFKITRTAVSRHEQTQKNPFLLRIVIKVKDFMPGKSSTVCNTKPPLQTLFRTSQPQLTHCFKHRCNKPMPKVSTKKSLCNPPDGCITQGKLKNSRSKTKCLLGRCQGIKKTDPIDDDVFDKSRNCVDSSLKNLLLQLKQLKI
ncbi:uncharacterized protein LOC130626997 [Hydractinia symbiolongicarpus]|uniref:uncharacterized protein LOC130626997 n=1 Tax=Hydractinia symbiolongicarpus TaxID=13093 RepID=UPI00254A4CCD|nr:uncharacterized protein LOC130626997 [Hydractinia symbiolongicarpus]